MKVTVGDGKYTVTDEDGRFKALRYGEEWRDCTGDGLIYTLAVEIESLRKELEGAKLPTKHNFVGAAGPTYHIPSENPFIPPTQ